MIGMHTFYQTDVEVKLYKIYICFWKKKKKLLRFWAIFHFSDPYMKNKSRKLKWKMHWSFWTPINMIIGIVTQSLGFG